MAELDAVVAVSRRGSFRAAAAELGMSPTALSRAVNGLEARLGVRLRRSEKFPLAFVLGAALLHLAVFSILALKLAYKPVLWTLLAACFGIALRTGDWRLPKPDEAGRERPLPYAIGYLFGAIAGQFAILNAPAMSATLRLLNEDSDAEFLANPRVVTANNMEAKIKITRNQPVPQLNFNEQTAQAVFSGFQDKEFGNTLTVTPCINKDDFVTLQVKPEISNKVGDATFTFSGATVTSPVIDKRELNSNVLIKSGDTLAIGGLLQDEQTKDRTKVPILGDIPILGYAFQEKKAQRVKRNLLVFVTPTVIKQGYGTGLEDQVTGLTHSGEEYADPNGWRNNAKGAKRLVPTSHRQLAADYPKPGVPPAPVKVSQ